MHMKIYFKCFIFRADPGTYIYMYVCMYNVTLCIVSKERMILEIQESKVQPRISS
jgi:hypothetical protein